MSDGNTHRYGEPRRRFAAIRQAVVAGLALSASHVLPVALASADEADFAREIRPILSDNCFQCHGPDEAARKAGLRLDTREGATALLDGGGAAIVPGDAAASELVRRIRAADPADRMPPADSGKALDEEQKDLLERWIAAGAPWEGHWAFQPIERPELPSPRSAARARNAIDLFVLHRLEEEGIEPSPPADRVTLIRRLSLDLVGLLPTPEQVDAFVNDQRPRAYERLVDRLLASPHHGERWARHWLDGARHADSNGYSHDNPRTVWPYRDWVIRALNEDMPFDRFTVEQLAGDLLENPSRDQLLATGFHRNTLINTEGGSDPEQFRAEAIVDRVSTTGAVWLGLTIGCAQCHSHKFDPVSQKEFYELYAFFNNCEDRNNTGPTVPVTWPHEDIAAASGEDEKPREYKAMVLRERGKARQTFVHVRGDFLRKGDPVEPDVPSVLPPLAWADGGDVSGDGGAATRLDLARWLVREDHPLTARVTVNRVWMRYFGRGLVETENDFGMQGLPPTHPELLDWLASEFVRQGWSFKALHRLIVNSATYRQSSRARQDLETVDPLNHLLARQARLRVDAEIVRDIALSAGGLLTTTIGGPPVHPPQPDGVYAFTQVSNRRWNESRGADRYRRGLYIFYFRNTPYPLLSTFDAPNFSTTCTRRFRSNTPLQSLALANDEAMFELARGLARRVVAERPEDDSRRLRRAFRRCLARSPSELELSRLREYLELQKKRFAADAPAAEAVAAEGTPAEMRPAEFAAWVAVSRALLNLDECITRE